MTALGVGLGLMSQRTGGAPVVARPFRIVPNGEFGAFVIAPHDDWGAIAYELTFANAGSNTVHAVSIGAPFGGWRWTGTHHLADIGDDPTLPLATLHKDIGSVDSGMQGNFGDMLFGGHFHGGITLSKSDVPMLSRERYVSAFSFGYEGAIEWPSGEAAAVTYEMDIQPDGNLAGRMTYSSPAAFTRAILSMVIANGFSHYSTDGGDTFINATAAENYDVGSADNVILRQPSTGYEIVVDTEQDLLTNITNEIVSDGMRLKHYVRHSSAGNALGNVTLARTVSFRKTEPDPVPEFTAITDTFDGLGAIPAGYIRAHNGGGTYSADQVAGVWEHRSGATPVLLNRWVRPITAAVLDGETTYKVEIDYNSLQANTGMIVYISKDASGSTAAGNSLPFNGSSTSYNLNSNGAATAELVFTLPSGVNPHITFDGSQNANRGVNISEIRISQI